MKDVVPRTNVCRIRVNLYIQQAGRKVGERPGEIWVVVLPIHFVSAGKARRDAVRCKAE